MTSPDHARRAQPVAVSAQTCDDFVHHAFVFADYDRSGWWAGVPHGRGARS
jgi:hypothetical protein